MFEDMRAFPTTDKTRNLHISLAGTSYCDKSYRMHRTCAKTNVLEYVLEGEGYVELASAVQHVQKDMIYFLPQNIAHSYYAHPERPYTKIFMNISGSLCQRIMSEYGLSGQFFFQDESLRSVFAQIPEIISSEAEEPAVQARLQGVFLEIVSRLSSNQEAIHHNEEALKLKEYLDANATRIVNGAELSATIFRSNDYCLKLFTREFGKTPYQYQLDRKMDMAQSMLANSRRSIQEIAEAVGYNDAHYFSNLFKQKCGIRPREYRKKMLK